MSENMCKHCAFIKNTFDKIENNYEYWLMTEVFVYLHDGKDYCTYQNSHKLLEVGGK
jgi:glutaredoxin